MSALLIYLLGASLALNDLLPTKQYSQAKKLVYSAAWPLIVPAVWIILLLDDPTPTPRGEHE